MKLFIAEKPSLAQAIAHGLGHMKRQNGYIECGDSIVTWCFGHIMEQYRPEDYDEKYKPWRMEDLPILPTQWKLKVKNDCKDQFNIIKGLVGKADTIVNAGDPDREGQLLIDEVLNYIGVLGKKPIQRILLNALDDKSVKEALVNLQDNEKFVGLRNSALARSRADWIIGMNMTRASTLRARKSGYTDAVASVGRVQTPTMALVCRREMEIKNFHPVDFYQLRVDWQHPNGTVPTYWKAPADTEGMDEEGRILNREILEQVAERIRGNSGTVAKVEQKKGQLGQRLPYSLSTLQVEAGRKYGFTPQEVLNTQQKLYEKKLTTYPRSDCEYLPTNQLADVPAILKNLAGLSDEFAGFAHGADTSIKSKACNDKKISAHHAIIPTTVKANLSELSEMEQKLYQMVAKAYLAQFYPPQEFLSTKIIIEAAGDTFQGSGKVILANGWKELYHAEASSEDEDGENSKLPNVEQGDSVSYQKDDILAKQTKPPKRFTPSSLIEAMKKISKYVKDKDLAPQLKECSGIGTEATRAAIIETIQKHGFVRVEKRNLVPTEKGYMLLTFLPDSITYPDITARWEKNLEAISSQSMSLEEFQQQQSSFIEQMLHEAKTKVIPPNPDAPKCPNCGKALCRRKGKNGYFWGCSGYPDCKTTFPDKNGKPDLHAKKGTSSRSGLTATCPKCGKQLRQINGKFGLFWGCEDRNCNAIFDDHDNKPVIQKCPDCGKGYLRRHPSKKKKGSFYWSCSERCGSGKFYNDKGGLPDLSK